MLNVIIDLKFTLDSSLQHSLFTECTFLAKCSKISMWSNLYSLCYISLLFCLNLLLCRTYIVHSLLFKLYRQCTVSECVILLVTWWVSYFLEYSDKSGSLCHMNRWFTAKRLRQNLHKRNIIKCQINDSPLYAGSFGYNERYMEESVDTALCG